MIDLTPDDDAALIAASETLHKLGWAAHTDVRRLLELWTAFPDEARTYGATVDDYTNDLTMRDAIEIVLHEATEPLRGKLLQLVGDADERFRAATVDDSQASLAHHFCVREGWWWSRIPAMGELARYLATEK